LFRIYGLEVRVYSILKIYYMLINILLGIVLLLLFIFGFAWSIARTIIKQPRELLGYQFRRYDLKPQNVLFNSSDGLKLVGVFIPGNNSATIILLHGYGRSKEQMLPQASFLNRAGYNILMFDFRASGESDGKYITFGENEQADLVGAINYLKGRGDIDMNKIGLLGFSMGGAVALMKSADLPEVKAVVINSTYAHFRAVVQRNFRTYFKGLPFFPLGYIVLWLMKRQTGVDYLKINPITSLDKLKAMPLLIMHGKQDERIPAEDAMEFHKQAPWLEEFWLVGEATHEDVYTITGSQYEEKVVSFFRKYLH
jgi:uncharacterized protein